MENRKKVITAHNFRRTGFEFSKSSLTVPGQVLPIRTVLDRFRRGQAIQSFNPVYNPEVPPGYEGLDKIERIEAAREQANKVARIRQALANKDKRVNEPTPAPTSEQPNQQ